MNICKTWISAMALAAMAACGGGGAAVDLGAPAAGEPVPAAASDGALAFGNWMVSLASGEMDSREAFNTSTFRPTVQDDIEPVLAP
jgi:hypothetical protein